MAIDAISAFVVQCIRRQRIEQGLKVAEMARRTGIPLGSYSCLETGRYRMGLENLFRTLAVLGADIADVWPGPVAEVEEVTDSYIRHVVEQAREQQPKLVSHRDILKTVCKVYGLALKELSSPSRRRDRAEARAVATQIVAERPHLTLVELSRLLKRNVSSLSHCVRRMKERLTAATRAAGGLVKLFRFDPIWCGVG